MPRATDSFDRYLESVEPIPPGRYTVTVVDDTTVEVSEGPFTGRRIKMPAGWPLPKELRTAKVDVAVKETGYDRILDKTRPSEPPAGASAWYRGWECSYEPDRAHWTGEGYTAYKGGCDLDARTATGATWDVLLSNVDDEEDE